MTLPAGGSYFQKFIESPVDGTRPSNTVGTSVTPGNNVYGTAATLLAAADAQWTDSGDAYVLELVFHSQVNTGIARDGIATVLFVRDVSNVDVANNELDFAAPHGFATGDPFVITNSGGSLPDDAGGDLSGNYFVIRRSATSIAIATSVANAYANTAVDITAAGSGTHTVHCDKIRHLLFTGASAYQEDGGVRYEFPLLVPNGTRIDVKASVNNATVGTVRAMLRLSCLPKKEYAIACGTFVRTFGADTANSRGATLTPGEAAEGAYAALNAEAAYGGGAIANENLWWWEFGNGVNDGTINVNGWHTDIAIDNAGAKRIAIANGYVGIQNSEELTKPAAGGSHLAVVGETVHARKQVGGNAGEAGGGAGTTESVIAYGLGGRFVLPGAFTVAGTVTIDGVAAANGKTVEIYAIDDDGVAELVTTTTTGGGTGAFSASVPDNTRDYFASYDNDGTYGRSALDTPA